MNNYLKSVIDRVEQQERFKVGSPVEYWNGKDWVRTEIKKVTRDFVEVRGSGFTRIKKTTIIEGRWYRFAS